MKYVKKKYCLHLHYYSRSPSPVEVSTSPRDAANQDLTIDPTKYYFVQLGSSFVYLDSDQPQTEKLAAPRRAVEAVESTVTFSDQQLMTILSMVGFKS